MWVCVCGGEGGGGCRPGPGQKLILWRRRGNEEKKKNGRRSWGARGAGRKNGRMEGEWKEEEEWREKKGGNRCERRGEE